MSLGKLAELDFDAVIFDMDGTLIDSTPAVARAWSTWAQEHGLTAEQLAGHHGMPSARVVRRLLPETADLDVEVHPLPNLYGVNVLLRGLLGEGVAASTRFDPQAKAVGEWIRARHVEIPEELL